MTRTHRPRRLAALALAGAAALALAACNSAEYPNSIFTSNSDTNVLVNGLFNKLFFFGTIVFVLVEALLLYAIFKFRRRPGQPDPEHVHGNTTLEVLWTAIPVVILAFIAAPTVRTIFKTQAKAVPSALNVTVIGHQWWWEFRYPQYNVTTANELYIPAGRTVNFELKSVDVIHSFWIPALSGKRDVVPNHTNYIWFTPAATLGAAVWNGHCAEYCGASHANMKFRTYTVTPEEFDSWIKGQQSTAAFVATPAAGAPAATSATAGDSAAQRAVASQAGAQPGPGQAPTTPIPSDAAARAQGTTAPNAQVATATTPAPNAIPAAYVYPVDKMPVHTVPHTPLPEGLAINTSIKGDPARGQTAFMACIGCHTVAGNPMAMGQIGPNLTHVGSRHTIGAGLYPNDTEHLARWIKNARRMKPGILMPTLGLDQIDPTTGTKVTQALGGLTDQQIMDIVAYLQALK